MTLEVSKLLDYKMWSDTQIISKLKELSSDQFNKSQIANFNSIKDICLHLLHEVRYWYLFLNNADKKIEIFDDLSKNELLEEINNYNSMMDELYTSIRNNQFEIQWQKEDNVMQTTSEEIIYNWINHGSYHRGQIVTILRKLSIEVGMTDYFPFRYSLIQNQ